MNLNRLFCLSAVLFLLLSCNQPGGEAGQRPSADTLTEAEKHLPQNALRGLLVAEGLEVTPFASEPMLQNPTNMDVDDKGRVWVTEAYNYRPAINGNPTNALGDRIMILEDTNGDGHADTAKVFYQGPELNAPLGIAVLGSRVIISQSPYVWAFYDDNGDDKADRKEILFQGIGGEQHDHGVHAFSFGPDGKLYFNMGNEARTLRDAKGKVLLDGRKYKQGLTLRCNPDGSGLEVLAENFRNPYEVAVDSYGGLWQSDNDDDGNRGTRINYVMPHGQYGYTDEMTGAGWQSSRTNMEDSIPFRHWHLNDPGAVPNLLQTGAGSPTGMVIYEGDLFPQRFYGQMIHCDAGPNVVRAYRVQPQGAGFTAAIENILKGDDDPWFRPADISVAPDGSLMVADWYDPGVGGHAAGDQVRGRIYRVAPRGSRYTVPARNYGSDTGALQALFSPNLATRYLAFTALQKRPGSDKLLYEYWSNHANPARLRARVFWLCLRLGESHPRTYFEEAIRDTAEAIRIMALRAAAQEKDYLDVVMEKAIQDPSPAVRREAALALWSCKSPEAAAWWTALAKGYDGSDRWYLEALGIGAAGQWDAFFGYWLQSVRDPLSTPAGRDIVWRARSSKAIPYLAQLAADERQPLKDRLRYFRAFDFQTGTAKHAPLLRMLETSQDPALQKLVLHALDISAVQHSPLALKALNQVLDSANDSPEFIELTGRYGLKTRNAQLLQMALGHSTEPLGRDAAGLLLRQGGEQLVWQELAKGDSVKTRALLSSLAGVGTTVSLDILQRLMFNKGADSSLRRTAADKLGRSWSGEERVLDLLRSKKVPAFLVPDLVHSVSGAWRGSIREEADAYLPDAGKTKESVQAPTMADLAALKGAAAAGREIFNRSCGLCHKAGKEGFDFGPALTQIGSKLPPEALLDAIVHPSAGISFGYEGWELTMKDGSTISGILASKTETDLDIRFPGGSQKQVKTSEVKTMTQLKKSMMTEGLYSTLSNQDMANLLAFLETLK